MRWIPRVRMLFARRPVLYWACVAGVAAVAVLAVQATVRDAERERDSWGHTATVMVTTRGIEAGDDLTDAVTAKVLPRALIPPSALSTMNAGATARHAIAVGEIVVGLDVSTLSGPLAQLRDGWLGVVIDNVDTAPFNIGDDAVVLAAGHTLAPRAVVIQIIEGAVVVGVPADVAAAVADAANQRLATVALSANPLQP